MRKEGKRDMNNDQQLKVLDDYFKLMSLNGSAYVFNVAQKMGFFKPFMKKEEITAAELSATLDYKATPVELILNTLTTLELMSKTGDKYSLAPVCKLLTGSYENLSSDYWEHLPTLLQEGTPYKRMDNVEDSEKEYQTQVKSLEWMMSPSASYVANMFSQRESLDNLNILDVGAGSGVWSYAFLQENKNVKTTLADWPAVLDVAKNSAAEKSISDRVSYIEGNYHKTNFGSGYNMAILGNVAHIETEDGCSKLFQKIHESLEPGGSILIFDVYGENEKGELSKWLYQLGLAIRTENGKVHSPERLKELLSDTGYESFQFFSLDITPYTMGVVVGKKK